MVRGPCFLVRGSCCSPLCWSCCVCVCVGVWVWVGWGCRGGGPLSLLDFLHRVLREPSRSWPPRAWGFTLGTVGREGSFASPRRVVSPEAPTQRPSRPPSVELRSIGREGGRQPGTRKCDAMRMRCRYMGRRGGLLCVWLSGEEEEGEGVELPLASLSLLPALPPCVYAERER